MKKPLVDERVLEGIPEELIRPLLAMSIRIFQPHTVESYKQLLKEIRQLAKPCGEAGGESLFYIDLKNMAERQMRAMLDAQTWVRKTDSTAEATSLEINRWYVNVHSTGYNRALLVAYERAGLDVNGVRVRAVVTEATDRDI